MANSKANKPVLFFISAAFILILGACQFSQMEIPATETVSPLPTDTTTVTFTLTATQTLNPTAAATLTLASTMTMTPVPKPQATVAGNSDACDGGNPSFEAETRALINSQRTSVGLSALAANGALTSAARAHSQDMATSNTFSHTGSDGSDPFARMTAAGYSFSAAGENIYAGSQQYNSPSAAVSAWMGSADHRENILSNSFTEIGVGYWCNENSQYAGYFTADFGRP